MSSNELIVSLDIGTSRVRAIIGEISNGSINIIGVGTVDSEGIRRGSIVDIEQTVQSIRGAIEQAERMVGIHISEVYVGISGNHIQLHGSHGVVAVSNEDREIGVEDIDRVLQAAKVIALPPEREIIDIVPRQYVVDGLDGIQDPRGMIGVRLEVDASIVTGSRTAVHNLIRCVERAELKVAGLILMPLAASQLVLTKDERAMNTALVDIGAGTTTISLFDSGHLTGTVTLPIGGEHITNDISIGLRTQSDLAEKIKLKYGCAMIDLADPEQVFKVSRLGTNIEKQFSQSDLANIVEPRVQEIFQLVQAEVNRMTNGAFNGVYVLYGGTVSLPGLQELARRELDTAVRIASPDYIGVRDPSYTNGVGIIHYVYKHLRGRGGGGAGKHGTRRKAAGQAPGLFERIKNFLKEFI